MVQENQQDLIPDSVKKKVREYKPVGGSTVAKSPLFYEILELLAMGISVDEVSDWVASRKKGSPLRAHSIKQYIDTHIPNIATIGSSLQIAAESVALDAIVELEKTCRMLVEQIATRKQEAERAGYSWSPKINELIKLQADCLERLSKMRKEKGIVPGDEQNPGVVKTDKWTPEFAAAIAAVIMKEKSTKDGKLRKFQPEVIEDGE